MRVRRIALLSIGALTPCAILYLAYLAVSPVQTWTVRFPTDAVADPKAVTAVETSLLSRAGALGRPTVRYRGSGVFEVELLGARRSPEFASSVLTNPGEFWVRAVAAGGQPSCAASAPALFGPGSIEEARLDFNAKNEPVLTLILTGSAGRLFRDHSRQHVGEMVAVCLDQRPVAVPVIREEAGRYLQIGGFKSPEEVRRLAAILQGGSMPAGAEAKLEAGAA